MATVIHTCGTCRKASPQNGFKRSIYCRRFDCGMSLTDGCRNGWEPRGPNQRPLPVIEQVVKEGGR